MTRIALFLALAALGCAAEAPVSVTLTPESEAVGEALRAADARWEAAGVAADRIVVAAVGSEGTPVRLVPARAGSSETRVSYRGGDFAGVKWIELDSLNLNMVTHEMGHACARETWSSRAMSAGVR